MSRPEDVLQTVERLPKGEIYLSSYGEDQLRALWRHLTAGQLVPTQNGVHSQLPKSPMGQCHKHRHKAEAQVGEDQSDLENILEHAGWSPEEGQMADTDMLSLRRK